MRVCDRLKQCVKSPLGTLSTICLIFLAASAVTAVIQRNQDYHLDASNTDWVLLGGLTSTGISMRIRIPAGQTTTLTVRREGAMGEESALFSAEFSAPEDDPWYVQPVGMESLLEPNGSFVYETSRSGSLLSSGGFRTPAITGEAFDFSFATAGCSMTGSKNLVFDHIRNQAPLFMTHMGDFHYQDIETNDMPWRISTIDTVMGSSVQRDLWSSTPLAYTWDDHDWLGNNSDENEKEEGARNTALVSYQWIFPHYPLTALQQQVQGTTTTTTTALRDVLEPVPVYHAFTVGTVRFIVTDLRSESKQDRIYSDTQRDWLFAELEESSGQHDFVILITSKPWIGEAEAGEDNWMGAATDRTELSNLLSNLPARNVLAISSDAHMVGFDNGRNTYYGDGSVDEESEGLFSFPILQSGPLDRIGSTKGGPFSDGCYTTKLERNHQFSLVSFKAPVAGVQEEPCLSIKSYSGTDVILEKELCGQIYTQVPTDGSKLGTCDSRALSTTTTALGSISVGITILLGALMLWRLPCGQALFLFLVILLGLVATYAVGFAVPAVQDFPYSLRDTSIIALAQTVCVACFVALLLRSNPSSPKTRQATTDR